VAVDLLEMAPIPGVKVV
jgi:hypothetical protein